MQSDEARALYIPVGLRALGLEVYAVSQPSVEQLRNPDPGIG
jgi:hypothetical protein